LVAEEVVLLEAHKVETVALAAVEVRPQILSTLVEQELLVRVITAAQVGQWHLLIHLAEVAEQVL
jgi:hypothetical protein